MITPNPTLEQNEVHPVNQKDKEFHNGVMTLADKWYDIITQDGTCVNQNAAVLFCDSRYANRVIRDYCRVCPCRQECLSYAVATGQSGSVWGGFDDIYRTGVEAHVRHNLREQYDVDTYSPWSFNSSLWEPIMQAYEELAINPYRMIRSDGTLSTKKKKDKNYLVS